MLARLAAADLPMQPPQSYLREEFRPPSVPRQPTPKTSSVKRPNRLQHLAYEERLEYLASRENIDPGCGRHRFCCLPAESLVLPVVPSKPPLKVIMPPSPFSKVRGSAPQVPQAPLRPLRQWTPRSYFFPQHDGPSAQIRPWSVGEGGMGRARHTPSSSSSDRVGLSADVKLAVSSLFAQMRTSVEDPDLLPSSPKTSRTSSTKNLTSKPVSTETAGDVIQAEKTRLSLLMSAQLRQQMVAARSPEATQDAPSGNPPEKAQLESGSGFAGCSSPRKRSGVTVSFSSIGPETGAHSQAEPTSPHRRSVRLEPEAPAATAPDATGEVHAGAPAPASAQNSSAAPGCVPPGADDRAPMSPTGKEHGRSRSRSVAQLKSMLREKVRRLDRKHEQKVQQQRVSREQDMRRQQFNTLPKEEADAIQRVFWHIDVDGTGYIDHCQMLECLKELGLRGSNTLEKREINRICAEVGAEAFEELRSGGEDFEGAAVDIVAFALVLLPRVRTRLAELRSNELLRMFYSFDIRGTGKLGVQQCMEMARDMSIDQLTFRKIAEEVHGFHEGGVDFEEFQEMVVKAREHADRLIRERERRIKEATGIRDEVFQEFRRDIVDLHTLFQRYDTEGKGSLGPEELPLVLTEFGLMPKNPQEHKEVEDLLRATDTDNDGLFAFEEFLHFTSKVRTLMQERKRAALLQFFEKYDRDKSGSLSIEELSTLLSDLGVIPLNRKEQEELAALIQLVDMDGSGFIDFEEFVMLNQRIDQRLKSLRYEEEIEHALSLNFTESQLRDMRVVFDQLDVDHSNKLDANEVRNGLQMMKKQVDPEAFDAAFKALDLDGSGELDFLEFLDFMCMMRDGEGIFSEDTQHLPTRVKFLDVRVLRRVVEHFGLSKTYVSALGVEELVELFCNLFEIHPNDNLQEKLAITSTGDLFEVAKKRGGQHLNSAK